MTERSDRERKIAECRDTTLYRVVFTDGSETETAVGMGTVRTLLRKKYLMVIPVGHPGDLSDGGKETRFWHPESKGVAPLGTVTVVDKGT